MLSALDIAAAQALANPLLSIFGWGSIICPILERMIPVVPIVRANPNEAAVRN